MMLADMYGGRLFSPPFFFQLIRIIRRYPQKLLKYKLLSDYQRKSARQPAIGLVLTG